MDEKKLGSKQRSDRLDQEFRFAMDHLSLFAEPCMFDRDVVLRCTKRFGMIYTILPDEYKKDKEIFRAALEPDDTAIIEACDGYEKLYEVCVDKRMNVNYASMMAFRIDTILNHAPNEVLPYVSDMLKNDENRMVAVVMRNPSCFEVASDHLKHNERFLKRISDYQNKEKADRVLDPVTYFDKPDREESGEKEASVKSDSDILGLDRRSRESNRRSEDLDEQLKSYRKQYEEAQKTFQEQCLAKRHDVFRERYKGTIAAANNMTNDNDNVYVDHNGLLL